MASFVEPLRIGVLGAARISDTAIVGPAQLTGARLVAIAARDRSRATAFAQEHGVERVLDSYAEVIADPEVEVVYNPLPNGLHGPWNALAIAAGKHVLSEKPFASNTAEATEVRDAGRRAGVVVGEAMHYRYHPVMTRMLDLVGSGELGDLVRVETTMVIPAPDDADPRWDLALAGGAMMDLGCYALHAQRAMAPFAGGEPVVTSAKGGARDGHPGVDEWVDALVGYPSGVTGRAYSNMAGERMTFSLRVTGSQGEALAANFVLPQLDDRIVVTTPDGERTEHLGTRPSYAYELDAFAAAVREGAPFLTDSDDAVRTMQLIDATYAAAGFEPRPQTAL